RPRASMVPGLIFVVASRSASIVPSIGRMFFSRSTWVQATRRRMNAARCRGSSSIHAWKESQISGVVCPSSRTSQWAAASEISLALDIGSLALPETVEQHRAAFRDRLIEQGLGTAACRLGQMLLHGILRDAEPQCDLFLRIAVDLAQGKHLATAVGQALD